MTKFADAILTAEKISTKKEKFAVLSGFGHVEQRLLCETFNTYRVFGVRQYNWPQAFASVDPSYDFFFSLLDQLALNPVTKTRQLSGDAARATVTAVLGMYTEKTAKVLARVLNKDLECGANRDSFLKIYPALNIPQFGLMLAAKIEEIAVETAASKKQKKVVLTPEILYKKYGMRLDSNNPVLAEAKYDGNRLLAKIINGNVEYLARSGKASDYCTGLFDAELAKLEAIVGEPIVVDGEVLGKSFQDTMNAKGSDGDKAKANLRFFAFDWMTLAQWEANDCKRIQTDRSASLRALIEKAGCVKVIKSKSKLCYSIQELRDFYAEVLAEGVNPDGTLNGLGEGLIIKNPNGFYEWERSKFWFKWKPVIDLDLELVSWEHGTGRLSNTVGKIYLKGKDENGTVIECKCGSGLSDEMRDYIRDNFAKLVGSTVCIEAQEICLAEGAKCHSARFPIFIRFRDDK